MENLYQVCVLGDATDNGRAVIKTETVEAETISQATEQATANGYKLANIRVYPFCTPEDGDGQMNLARHTLASVENWERRNENAVMNPQRRNAWEREDMVSVACVAIAAVFQENPTADMHTLKTTAFSAIRAEQARKDRNSEREYMPGWIGCNVTPREARATCPALDKLVQAAVKSADMTDGQMNALLMSYEHGKSAQDIAEETGTKRATVYQTLYRAYYKVLSRAVEIDPDMDAFTAAGYTPEDIDETLAILRKRARWDKKRG